MGRCHMFFSKYYVISEFWTLVPLMCSDVLIHKIEGQKSCFNTKNERFSIFGIDQGHFVITFRVSKGKKMVFI